MAANREQGSYVLTFLIGFTALTAGLVALAEHDPIIGVILILSSMALLIQSFAGFRRIKHRNL